MGWIVCPPEDREAPLRVETPLNAWDTDRVIRRCKTHEPIGPMQWFYWARSHRFTRPNSITTFTISGEVRLLVAARTWAGACLPNPCRVI